MSTSRENVWAGNAFSNMIITLFKYIYLKIKKILEHSKENSCNSEAIENPSKFCLNNKLHLSNLRR